MHRPTPLSLRLGILLVSLCACRVNLQANARAQVNCSTTSECPPDFRCSEALGRCTPLSAGDDPAPPEVSAGSVAIEKVDSAMNRQTIEAGAVTYLARGQALRVSFSVNKPLGIKPRLELTIRTRTQALTLVEATDDRFVFALDVEEWIAQVADPALIEGGGPLSLRLVDTFGSAADGIEIATVVLDFTPPELIEGSTSLTLTPSAQNPLLRLGEAVRDVTYGTTLSLSFKVNETLADAPMLTPNMPLKVRDATVNGLFYTFGLSLDERATYAQGALTFQTTLIDLAGNASTVTLAETRNVDTLVPMAPDVDTPNAILYRRVPFGSRQSTANQRQLEVHVDPTLAPLEPGGLVLAFDRGTTGNTDAPLAWEDADALLAPASPGLVFAAADSPDLWLSEVDRAGNESPRAAVKDVEWIATPGAKVAGSTFGNPSVLSEVGDLRSSLQQNPLDEREASADYGALLREGDAPHVVSGKELWSRRQQATALSPLTGHRAAYDNIRGVMMLVAGDTGSTTIDTSVREWSSSDRRWQIADVPGGPNARRTPAFALDRRRGDAWLFGGEQVGAPAPRYNDLWHFTPSTATWQQELVSGPPGRNGACFVYDPVNDRFLLFGGEVLLSGPPVFTFGALRDLWAFDAKTRVWQNLTPAVFPAEWPSARAHTACAYDEQRKAMLVWGGRAGVAYQTDTDTMYEFAVTTGTFTTRVVSGARPPALASTAAAYDPKAGALIVHGGLASGGTPVDSLWVWNSTLGTWAIGGLPPLRPSARSDAAAAYDPENDTFIVTGGRDAGNTILAETWLLNRSTGRWSNATANGQWPTARDLQTYAYDSDDDSVFMFGGSPFNNELWQWRSEAGIFINRTAGPSNWPSGRYGVGSAYIPLSAPSGGGRVILYGGFTAASTSAEFWAYTPATNTMEQVAPTGAPGPLALPGAAYDPIRHTMVMFSGKQSSGGSITQSVWELLGNTWSDKTPVTSPPGRTQMGVDFDTVSNQMIVFGGFSGGAQQLDSLDEWNGQQWTGLAPATTPSGGQFENKQGFFFDPLRGVGIWALSGTLLATDHTFDPLAIAWSTQAAYGRAPSPRNGAIVFQTRSSRAFVFAGANTSADVYERRSAAQRRPGAIWRVPIAASGIGGATIEAIDIHTVVGALGHSGPTATDAPGATLSLWQPGLAAWEVLESNDASTSNPAALDATLGSAAAAQALVGSEQSLYLLFSPKHPSGTGQALGTIGLDALEIRLRYRN